ncbi:thiamine diphosphokinase [Lentibacillus sp. Marseille-P4043]|uniref:thiamine diphosphokinase n=1 Tax=Lentibacillus sp. Marseille-P4043 TaxID=2040293 RepID=UPI000D0B8089|nr:thiamine diphosphokinase [Lentibacillus sp. Marseille-P4043]
MNIAIVGNGPLELIPDLISFERDVDVWIGADRGALTLIKHHIMPDYAVGDFDSINPEEKAYIKRKAKWYKEYPIEKDQTDLEIAISKAYDLKPAKLFLFGVTGGRLDHELINIQTLFRISQNDSQGIIVDKNNQVEMMKPGTHTVTMDEKYPAISFIPFTKRVKGLTLEGFYYPLVNQTITWGSTLCISNKLLLKNGTFSFNEGILLLIKSRDAMNKTIPK